MCVGVYCITITILFQFTNGVEKSRYKFKYKLFRPKGEADDPLIIMHLLLPLKLFITRKISDSQTRIEPQSSAWIQVDAWTIELLFITIGLVRWQREDYDVYWFVHATYLLLIQHSCSSLDLSEYLINKYIYINDSQLGKLFATQA